MEGWVDGNQSWFKGQHSAVLKQKVLLSELLKACQIFTFLQNLETVMVHSVKDELNDAGKEIMQKLNIYCKDRS